PASSQECVGDGQISERLLQEVRTGDKSQPAGLFGSNRRKIDRFLRQSFCESCTVGRESLAYLRKAGSRGKVRWDHDKHTIRSFECGYKCIRIVLVRDRDFCSTFFPSRSLLRIPNDRANLLALR